MTEINVTIPAAVADLSKARENVVRAAGKTGEVINAYAVAMCQAFDLRDNQGNVTTAWFDLKGKLKAGVNDERKAFKVAMESAGFESATSDVYWQRVKVASGYKTASMRVTGTPSIDEKTMADLKTMINRIFKAEENGDSSAEKSSKVKGALMDVFSELGGDVDNLG
jgi:hypothetical protein